MVTRGLVVSKTAAEAATLLDADGYLKSRYQAMIGTKIAGRVEQMRVDEGMKVKKGDTLAVIEHNDLKAMLASREAQAQRTAAELEEARADLWEKEREDRRVSRLFAQRSATPEESEKAQAGHKKAAARVAALEAAVKLMKANIEEIKATIVTMHLYAPFDGTVVEKQGEVGEIISPTAMSSSLGRTAVVTIANLEKMDVETDISEAQLWRIAIGQPASVSVTAIPSKRYRGRLRQVLPMSDRTAARSRSRSRSSTPTTSFSPSWPPPFTSCRASRPTARTRARSFLFVPKSAVFQESGHDLRLGRPRRQRAPQESGRGGHDDRRPGAGRVGAQTGRRGRPEPAQNSSRDTRRFGSPNKGDCADRERFMVHGRNALDRLARRRQGIPPRRVSHSGAGRTSICPSRKASSWP